MADAVEGQLVAYNAHDVDAFVGFHSDTVTIEDGHGVVAVQGHAQLRERYAMFFARAPDVHAEVVSRIRIGSFVVDEERITGSPAGDQHAVAIYRLDAAGLIDNVRLLS